MSVDVSAAVFVIVVKAVSLGADVSACVSVKESVCLFCKCGG